MAYFKPLPTIERLREVFHYDSDTGVLIWKVATARKIKVGDIAGTWHRPTRGFHVSIDRQIYKLHRICWAIYHGVDPGDKQIDHIDRDRANNRISNLRLATHNENQRNATAQVRNTSGFKGVSKCSRSSRWFACIRVNGKTIYLGRYDTPKEAHAAYCAAAAELHGEFACTA